MICTSGASMNWIAPLPRGLGKIETYLEIGEGFPGTLPELVAWAQTLLDQVPPEYRASTEFRCYGDEGGLSIYASWSRPETPEDIAERAAEAEAREARDKAARVALERETLAALKAKYE